jgi:hypothetical protein
LGKGARFGLTDEVKLRIFKNKWFARFAQKNRIDDEALKSAVSDIEAGNFDASLGGFVYKQRVAREGGGKRGGYRTIVLFKQGDRAFFVYGFAKSKRDNIEDHEMVEFKNAAKQYFAYSQDEINRAIRAEKIFEIGGD